MDAQTVAGFGYAFPRQLPDGQWIGILRHVHSWDLVVGIKASTAYVASYSYRSPAAAVTACKQWNGAGDPPGLWSERFFYDQNGKPKTIKNAALDACAEKDTLP